MFERESTVVVLEDKLSWEKHKYTSKGGFCRREKIIKLMRALAPSAATASDATTTSGLGSGLSSGS